MAGINNNSFPPLDGNMNSGRQGTSPTSVHAGQVNGNGMGNANYMAPLPVGHQQDINYLYAQLQELGGLLKSNREKVNQITKTAEEVAKRGNGVMPEADSRRDSDAIRIRDLERELAKANHIISLYKHEQSENTRLIAEYEDAMGTATEQIRNYCTDNTERYLAQRRYYNNLLQQEKDEHLQSRLDRDHWMAQTTKVSEMVRTAYKMTCDEWGDELKIIAALQEEVRVYRMCLSMAKEKPDEETGWPYLKDVPLNLEGS